MSQPKQKKPKIGRPRLPKGEAKGKIVNVRFTKAEADLLSKAARANSQTVSEWIRATSLGAM